jgi:hypothetical protein
LAALFFWGAPCPPRSLQVSKYWFFVQLQSRPALDRATASLHSSSVHARVGLVPTWSVQPGLDGGSQGHARSRPTLDRGRASQERLAHLGGSPSAGGASIRLGRLHGQVHRTQWYGCLFTDATFKVEALPRLLHARLERENAGVRLYGGIEVDAQGRQQWRQAWLCTPTPARAREILLRMLETEGQS